MNTNELGQTPAEAVTPTTEEVDISPRETAEAVPLEPTDTATEVAISPRETAEAVPLEPTDTATEIVNSPRETAEAVGPEATDEAAEAAAVAEVVTPRGETTEAVPVPNKATDAPGHCKPDLFGPPALVPGEDPALYEAARAAFCPALEPKDALEELSARDIADLSWEKLRMDRLKANFLRVAASEGVEKILKLLTPSVSYASSKDLGRRWTLREPKALKEVADLLAPAGLTEDAVMALTLVANLDAFERINRMAAGAEARRHVSLRELDRHRAAVATALKEKAQSRSFWKK
jgi:hypothetical protein